MQRGIRAYVRELHRSARPIDDREVDALLGITEEEERLDPFELVLEHGNELIDAYDGSPYEVAREAVRRLQPKRTDVLYDLGCGYGRVVLWAALVSEAEVRGVELVPVRATLAQHAIRRLRLANARVVQGNVLSTSFDDGNLFFLFDPFFRQTMERVSRKLARIARAHPIRIASHWMSNDVFARRRWLREMVDPRDTSDDPYRLRLFASI
ncbi:MAG TPA: class I SAM-dependent methyltransferase [Thermoanaerobaculia bacterium]|jgi:SAM-dependent methyltransferase